MDKSAPYWYYVFAFRFTPILHVLTDISRLNGTLHSQF